MNMMEDVQDIPYCAPNSLYFGDSWFGNYTTDIKAKKET